MAKVLLESEALEIIKKTIEDPCYIECADAYKYFLEDLGELIAKHFGGELRSVSEPMSALEGGAPIGETQYALHFDHNDGVPEGGGVYAEFDTDITIEEWAEEER